MLETLPTGRVVPGHGGCVEGPDTEGEWIEVVEAGGRQDEERERFREALAAIRLEYDARGECADTKLMRDYADAALRNLPPGPIPAPRGGAAE
jgi:hypothetical protein